MVPHVALDAMGGDYGPSTIVVGAARALLRRPGMRFSFFGDRRQIEKTLNQHSKLQSVSTIHHTDVTVMANDKPRQALRKKNDSSMGRVIAAVKQGDVDGGISSGSTGALMAMAKIQLGTMSGIERPALTGLVPAMNGGKVVMLDMGANTECDSENLVQFAVMGAVYARMILGSTVPRVALLNIGTEEIKGTEEIRQAAARLRTTTTLPMEFTGFIEGDKLSSGIADVIVHDGFSGNIALKTIEGTAHLTLDILRRAFRKSLRAKVGYLISRSVIRHLGAAFDSNNYNGAVLLGLNGIMLKSHGGANAQGIANAIHLCADMIENDITQHVAHDLQNFQIGHSHVANETPYRP